MKEEVRQEGVLSGELYRPVDNFLPDPGEFPFVEEALPLLK